MLFSSALIFLSATFRVRRFAWGQADGVEDGAEVAPVAAGRAFDGGFQLFDFVPAFGLAGGEWGEVFAPGVLAASVGRMVRIPCGSGATTGGFWVLRLALARLLRMTGLFVGWWLI